jgi:hypothetical protein
MSKIMKFSLRTLLIVAILAPPLLAGLYFAARYLLSNERAQIVATLVGAIAVWAVLKSVLAPDRRIE